LGRFRAFARLRVIPLLPLVPRALMPDNVPRRVKTAPRRGARSSASSRWKEGGRKGFRSLYRRASRLFDELKLARADGSYPRLLGKLARVDVLIIDDFAVAPVNDTQRSDLLEVLEDRYGTRSTNVTSQLPSAQWHDYLADPTLADAICDRLLNNAHRFGLKGPSRRKEQTQQT